MSACIYRITNTVNGKCYVGQTVQALETRWYDHCRTARRNSNTHFHNAIRKYGPIVFNVELLEETTVEQLNDRERYWIAELHPAYNMTEGGEGLHGYQHSPEIRAKISAAQTGEKAPNYGKTFSVETRNKMSAAKRGRRYTIEHRAKISAALSGPANPNYGRKMSAETRAKISAARRNRKMLNKENW